MPAQDGKWYSAAEDDDPSEIASRAQMRILKLRRNRDRRVQAAIRDTHAALETLRNRVTAYQEERRQNKAEQVTGGLVKMLEAVEGKKSLEMKMEEEVRKMHTRLTEVEEMMKAGFSGREESIRQVLEDAQK